jgi:hypothetical protein
MMACDDLCRLYFDETPGSTTNETKIIDTSYGGFRRFHTASDNRNRISEWVNLTEGEHYYIRALHGEGTGSDYLTVGVEIERDNSSAPGHHHSVKEVQMVEARIERNKDTVRVTIDNPDNGNFLLNFKKSDGKYKTSRKIKANANAGEFLNGVRYEWCRWTLGTMCKANLTMYDADGNITTSHSKTVKNVYHLMLDVQRSTPSTTNILVVK